MDAQDQAVFTLEELAEFLRVPNEAVLTILQAGLIPGRNVAGSWRFLRRAIEAWLSQPPSEDDWLFEAEACNEDLADRATLADEVPF